MILPVPVLSDLENICNNLSNGAIIRSAPAPHGGRTIVYAVKNLAAFGGVETRIAAYAEALERIGHRVAFITERNRNRAIRHRHLCLHLNFHARNFQKSLALALARLRADAVELQIKNRRSTSRLDIDALKAVCRVGCTVHGELGGLHSSALAAFDYRVLVSDLIPDIDYRALPHCRILPNAVDPRTAPVWRYSGQNKALIISRLRDDKYRQLCAAVEFCRDRGFGFEIAGAPVGGRTASRLRKKYALSRDVFSPGAIHTPRFLRDHAGEYLFVAGVGQVLLEAGAAGYPCLLASGMGAHCCTFLTRSNIRNNFGRNLTLAYPSGKLGQVQVTHIDPRDIADFDISQEIRELFPFDRRFDEYLRYILPGGGASRAIPPGHDDPTDLSAR